MSQYYINTGNVANNGLGDPLRTAFNDTNLNFTQIFTAGPVGSNIQIADNTILTTNTNGNLILATNGTGAIVPAASIVPDLANVRMIGSGTNRFNTVYTQYLDATSGTIAGNLFVNGSLLVSGNTVSVDYSTLNIANSVITVSAGAPYPALADGSGIVVGGAGATFLYGAVDNAWVSNLPVMAPQFIGDGSMLSNVQGVIDGANIQGNTIGPNVTFSSLTTVGTLAQLSVQGNVSVAQNILSNTITTGEITAVSYSGNAAGLSSISGANITGTVGNATYATFAGAAETANVAALATQAVNADLALAALSANTANSAQYADIANWANCANTAYTAYVANAAVVAGYANTVGILPALTVTGNIVTAAILTNNYLFANGQPVTFSATGTNYSNANVAAYLPLYSGDLNNLGNITSYGMTNLGNTNINSTLTVGVVSATGNVSGQAVYANGFFYANGSPFTGSGYVLGDQQFYGNGSTGPYTMTQSSTNNAVLVTVNGLTQTPGTSYTVSGNLITFSDTVNSNELVDLRFLGTGAGGGGGGNGTPGGANTQVQFNNAGQFGGNSNFTWDNSAQILSVPEINFPYGNAFISAGMGFHISTEESVVLQSTNTSNVGNAVQQNWFFDSDGVITLPTSNGYRYTATLAGQGDGTAQVVFDLVSALSGAETEWQAAITVPGSGYNVGQTFTFDETFLRIPGASVTITINHIGAGGSVTDVAFTPPPLLPTSIQRDGSSIAIQADNRRWTFGLNGNLTLPATITGVATAVTLNAGLTVGYSTAVNVPTIANTGSGVGLTVDIIANTANAGSITSVTLNQRGQGYAPGDQLTINQPSSTGNGELTVVAVETVDPSINYSNGQPYISGANTGNIGFSGDTIYDINGPTLNNSDAIHGQSAGINLPPNGGGDLNLFDWIGNIVVQTGTSGGPSQVWTFDNLGNIVLPDTASSINYPNGVPYGGVVQSNTAPANPTASTIWYDPVTGRTYVYYNDGTTSQWVDAAPAGEDFGNIAANVLPSANLTFTIGNATNQWANIYTGNVLANSFFYSNGTPFTSGGVIQSNTAPGNATSSTLWYDPVTGRLYVYYNDGTSTQWVDAAPAGEDYGNVAANIIPSAGNTFTLGNTTNSWVSVYAGDTTYSTPGAGFFAATPAGITFGLTAAEGIAVNGNGISIGGTGGVNIFGVAGAQISLGGGTGGNITVASPINSSNTITATAYYGDGSHLTGINVSSNTIYNGTSNVAIPVANGNVYINSNSGTDQQWTFDTTGNLTIPGTINGTTGTVTINPNPNTSGLAWQFGDEGANISLLTAPQSDDANIGGIVLPGGAGQGFIGWIGANPDSGTQFANTLFIDSSNTVTIGTNLGMGLGNVGWVFDPAGNLTLPAGAVISDVGNAGVGLAVANPPTTMVISGADFTAVNTTYTRDPNQPTPTWYPAGYNPSTDPYILFDNSGWGIFVPGFGQSLYVNTGTITAPLTQWNTHPPLGSVAPTGVYTFDNPVWQFGIDGTTTFPGNIVGNGASPAPSINGFDTITALKFSAVGNVSAAYLIGNVVGNLVSGSNSAGFDQFGDFVMPSSTYFGMSANMGMAVTANTTGGTISAPQSGQSLTLNTNSGAPQYNWTFDSAGALTLPQTSAIFERAVGDWRHGLNIVGESDNSSVLIYNYGVDGKGFGASALYVNNSNVQLVTNNQRPGGQGQTWTFDNTGNLTAPGNITATNLYSTGVVSAAGNVRGGNINTAGLVSATGNVYANTFVGNGAGLTNLSYTAVGNITGSQSNVTLVAGSYNYVFDNTGNLTLPVNGDLVFSANTTLTTGSGTNGNITVNPDGIGQFVVTSITPAYFGNVITAVGNVTVLGTGAISTPNVPAFRVYGNGVTGGLNSTTNGTGILNGNNWAVDYNQGGYLNSTTGVFTAPVAGLYQVNLVARVANNVAPASQAIVYKNYGTGNISQVMWEVAANCTTNHFGVSTASKLAVGDTLTLKVTLGNISFDNNDNWSVVYLG